VPTSLSVTPRSSPIFSLVLLSYISSDIRLAMLGLRTTPELAAAEEAGFDLSLLARSLSLSPEERLLEHQISYELVIALQEANSLTAS
jgi:hypothetical protein